MPCDSETAKAQTKAAKPIIAKRNNFTAEENMKNRKLSKTAEMFHTEARGADVSG
jgi:hypothetical protein